MLAAVVSDQPLDRDRGHKFEQGRHSAYCRKLSRRRGYAVDFPTIDQMFARDVEVDGCDVWKTGARGWAEIAYFMMIDPDNLRHAYPHDPVLQRQIYKHGGSVWAPLGNLMNLAGWGRERQRVALRKFACRRSRNETGQFKRSG